MSVDLVVCSLEAWDDVWRRNQFLTRELLERNPSMRVLFVEPPADPLLDVAQRRRPQGAALRALRDDGRLHALRPLKPLPRRLGTLSDRVLRGQVLRAVARLQFARPIVWINDVTYAPLIAATGWPSIYDVTDDWLLAPFAARELTRLRALDELALKDAREVVVCSPALAESRGRKRDVTLVPNGVDVEHFQRRRPRPGDLPSSPVAVYVGTLHDARLDIDLVLEVARSCPELQIVLVGPDSLAMASRERLVAADNVHLLGARPYESVPAYLQHADVIVVPHVVTPFTESLDPIKAYECAAVNTPTVATPVAGFRELGGVVVTPAANFASAVRSALADSRLEVAAEPVGWGERAATFGRVLARVAAG